MKVVVLILACLAAGGHASIDAWGPAKPHWPSAWKAFFSEQTSYDGPIVNTTGWGMYNYPSRQLIWARVNGTADPVCNSSIPLRFDTPCAHIVSNTSHYLYTEDNGHCCLCCTEDQGCGVPSSEGFKNFTYGGQYRYYGQKVYEWVAGAQGYSVAYLETTEKRPENRTWVGLFTPMDNYTAVWNFTTNVDSSDFQLPTSCTKAKYCPTGICSYIRNQNSTKLQSSGKLLKNLPIF